MQSVCNHLIEAINVSSFERWAIGVLPNRESIVKTVTAVRQYHQLQHAS